MKKGDALTVSPYAIYWNNGNCYLYAFLAETQKFRYFRVDRMERINTRVFLQREGKELFNKLELTGKKAKVFNMYEGKEYNVKMRFINRLADQVIDEFGKDVMMIPTDNNHFTVMVPVSVSPTFYAWVATFGHSVKILAPDEVVAGMKKFIKDVQDMYKDEGKM